MTEEVNKTETSGARSVVRPPTAREVGQPRIVTSSRFIQTSEDERHRCQGGCVSLNQMYQEDDAVFVGVDRTNEKVLKAMYTGKFIPGPSNSRASQEAAEFLNYNIRNMSFGSWLEAMTNANTDTIYGWSFMNIVTEVRRNGPYAGKRVLKKLAPRSQKSLYGWVWDRTFGKSLVGSNNLTC